ncbi:MAG TPA: hypothetical protein VFQ45_17555, partial [Longimicrobium sp.]|nr:hypothetical protein [Longimicrobium sp.]
MDIKIPTGRRGAGAGAAAGRALGRMRGKVPLLVGAALLLVLVPSTFTYISPGHVGIVIHKLGGGVD